MLKIKDKNNYETKVTTIDGYSGVTYEKNLKQFRKELKKKGGYIDGIVTIKSIVIYREKVETDEVFYLSSYIGNNYISDIFTDEVEIIEEPKKIGKLPYYSLEKIQKSKNKDEWRENRLELLEKRINDYHNKTNELIDEINNLKEK